MRLLALVFAVLSALSVWSLYEANRDANRSYHQETKAEQEKAADRIAHDCSVIPNVNPALRDCLREAIKTYQERDTASKDLQAQQEMAFWAFVAALVSGAGLIISVGGLGLLFSSLRQTRQAITNDRTIGEAQVRAYLSVHLPEEEQIVRPLPSIILRIVNTGQSPAHNVQHLSNMFLAGFPLPDGQGDLFAPDPASIQRGTIIGAGSYHRVEAALDEPLSEEQKKSIMNEGEVRLYVASVVTYYDVFKREQRKTRFCAYLAPNGKTIAGLDGRRVREYEWALANVHNDAT